MLGVKRIAPAVCAICGADIHGIPRRQPLGKGGAIVNACAGCVVEPPISKFGPERAYEGAGPRITREFGLEIDRAERRMFGERQKARLSSPPMWSRTPGTILVRVRVFVAGIARDRMEAEATLAKYPWFSALRYLGADNGWFLWERPNARALAKARAEAHDVIADLNRLAGSKRG